MKCIITQNYYREIISDKWDRKLQHLWPIFHWVYIQVQKLFVIIIEAVSFPSAKCHLALGTSVLSQHLPSRSSFHFVHLAIHTPFLLVSCSVHGFMVGGVKTVPRDSKGTTY